MLSKNVALLVGMLTSLLPSTAAASREEPRAALLKPAPAFATVIAPRDGSGEPGTSSVRVRVTTTAAITIGSIDLALAFDPTVLEAVAVASPLDAAEHAIDNAAGRVVIASATGGRGQELPAAGVLFTVDFTVRPTARVGCVELALMDLDGVLPDDVAGPVPSIPPASIVYATMPARFCVFGCGNGTVEEPEACDDGDRLGDGCCDGRCQFQPPGTSCADAACLTGRTCDGRGGCQGGEVHECQDGNPCTVDFCDPQAGCTTCAPGDADRSGGTDVVELQDCLGCALGRLAAARCQDSVSADGVCTVVELQNCIAAAAANAAHVVCGVPGAN
jgi:hypothetical protein